MKFVYQIKKSSSKQISELLFNCDKYFMPKLSEKVNIVEYSEKLFRNAICFEAWFERRLIGLVAMYVNKKFDSFGFITNVSVQHEFMKNGIASNLLRNCISFAKEVKLKNIKLEVNKANESAINLYHKFKFKKFEEYETYFIMILNLIDEHV